MSMPDLDKAYQFFIKYFESIYKKFGEGEYDRFNKNIAIYILK